MTTIPLIQQGAYAIAGLALINALSQAIWNHHTIRKLTQVASYGGIIVGAITYLAVFVLRNTDLRITDPEEALAWRREVAKNCAFLAVVSTVALISLF